MKNEIQSVMMVPKLGLQSPLKFNYAIDNELSKVSSLVNPWNDINRTPGRIELFVKSKDEMKSAYAQIYSNGQVAYQEPTYLNDKTLYYARPLQFLKRCIDAAESVYPIFGYYGEIEVWLNICGLQDVRLEFPIHFHIRGSKNNCQTAMINIQKTIDLRDPDALFAIFKSILEEYCRWFNIAFDDETLSILVTETFP